MRILLTGATGFVAAHLIRKLQEDDHELILTSPHTETVAINGKSYVTKPCELTNKGDVQELITTQKPDAIVHLAAISNVPKADAAKADVSLVNVVGTQYLCAAASSLGKPIIFLFTSTALVYGGDSSLLRCEESTQVEPSNVYGLTKLSAEYLLRSFESNLFHGYIVRPFNHIGPGQSADFVCTALAKRVHDAKDGSMIPVGNLMAKRDFSDVRDIVRAYSEILRRKPSERLFVLGSGEAVTIRSVLDKLIEISGKRIEVQVDNDLLRNNDEQIKVANSKLALTILGWKPSIPLETSLREIYSSLTQ